jgi:hypothetical protein
MFAARLCSDSKCELWEFSLGQRSWHRECRRMGRFLTGGCPGRVASSPCRHMRHVSPARCCPPMGASTLITPTRRCQKSTHPASKQVKAMHHSRQVPGQVSTPAAAVKRQSGRAQPQQSKMPEPMSASMFTQIPGQTSACRAVDCQLHRAGGTACCCPHVWAGHGATWEKLLAHRLWGCMLPTQHFRRQPDWIAH